MLRRFCLVVAALCVSAYGMAAAPSIGTVTARGEVRIDSFAVQGSGTVFDRSVLETGESAQSAGDVRLGNDSVVTLLVDSRGTLHRDHFELQRGEVQLSSSSAFGVEANGLAVTPIGSHGSGQVSIGPGDNVNVIAQSGSLEVRSAAGTLVAQVHPGHPLAFSPLQGRSAAAFSAQGVISAEDGRYYLHTAGTDVKYEVKGDAVQKFVGAQVAATGTLDAVGGHEAGSAATVNAENIVNVALNQNSAETKAIIAGLSIEGIATVTSVKCGAAVNRYPCCPKGSTAEHCCPGNDSSPMCCSNLLYPNSMCHHSY